MTQKDFPRGGKKPLVAPSTKSILFEKNNLIKARKIKTKRTSKKSNDEETLIASRAQSLTFSNICEGMVILGRVHLVRDYDLIISLPGRLTGRVKVTDISESYTNLLQNVVKSEGDSLSEFRTLAELFSPGDNVITYVKALGEENWRISLSLEPNLINQNLSSSSITNKSKIICSISSVEDHGYVLDTGIPNCRGFLSKTDIEDRHNSIYFPGKQIMCAVKNAKSSDNSSIITLTTKDKYLQTVMEHIKYLDSLLPGMQMTLSITKILPNGLQVSYNGDKIGYINQIHLPKTLSNYTPGLEVDGTLLYIIPTVKFAFFTLLKQIPEKAHIIKGEIINGRVSYQESSGIILKLGKDLKGLIPYKRTHVHSNKIKETFLPESDHKCRVLTYDLMDRVYICSTEKNILEASHFSIESFVHGEKVDVIVDEINRETGFVKVSSDRIVGTIPPYHTSDSEKLSSKLKVGDKVKAKVLSNVNKKLTFTMKPLLINSNLPIFDDIHQAEVGCQYQGTVRQITERGILVKFFGELAGWVPLSFLEPQLISRKWNHFVGEVVTVTIKNIDLVNNRLTLKIVKEIKKKMSFKVGESVNGAVLNSSTEGIQVKITKDDSEAIGFIPSGHIAPCPELGNLLASKSIPGDKISALVFSTAPALLLSVSFVPQAGISFKNLKPNSTILCSVKNVTNDVCRVTLPIDNFFGKAEVKKNFFDSGIRENQILFSKVLSIDKEAKKVSVSTRLHDLWKVSTETMSAIDTLGIYLLKTKELSEKDYFKTRPISSVKLGQKVDGTVETITEHGLVLKLKKNLKATVRREHYQGGVKIGDKVKGVVLWINFIYELLEVTLLPHLVSSISVNQTRFQKLPLETKLRGTIILITNWFLIVLVKGEYKGGFVVMPTRLHLNDLNPDLSTYKIGQKVRCFVVLNSCNSLNICLPKSVFEAKKCSINKHVFERLLPIKDDSKQKDQQVSKKRKISLSIDSKEKDEEEKKVKRKIDGSTLGQEVSQKKRKKQEVKKEEEEEEQILMQVEENTELTLPECGFYWDKMPSLTNQKEETSSESENDGEIQEQLKQKKKKLTAAERREQEREKEREIREREEALAATDHMPKSVDQFDRLVLGSPDSSLIWLQYMAYHLQATEVEKARAVAKRAVKTINFREEDERLNVWQAWLNLEIKFGNTESLNDVLHEAVRVNDAAKIYSHMLTAYCEAGKQIEMEKIVNMIVKKFKDQPEMWIKCGAVLLKVGLKDKSRYIMQRAIQSLPASEHVNLIVRFANMENSHGDKERSQTLFEQILNSYPKRTDVWSCYVDSLIKSGDIEIARRILERSVTTQVLPPRKMKVLFKKYINFEEQHGNEKNVQNVRDMANEYVKEHSGQDG
ncbi:protein RRP5 homolog [Leptopilina heterotoma]|uniref:protein RRP5 homolog n=1 Tax=Leptopilina heterotoma TaxID=63436 RepID=UPI001CA9B717|nr:protein RRP5 homolog [Leptopilina heterotoma]